MKFFRRTFSRNFTIPDIVDEFPSVVLMTDTWNDFGYVTYFHMYYISKPDTYLFIGAVKIGSLKNRNTDNVLEYPFERLDEDFCSLGQSIAYYENLGKLDEGIAREILTALKDVATNEVVYSKVENEGVFKESLLRFSEAGKALKEAGLYFGYNAVVTESNLDFQFEYQIPGATFPHVVNLSFAKSDLPYRINCFVGKNATGKTRVLSEIASRLSGAKKSGTAKFIPDRPSFSKVIAISYSAFDELYKPFEKEAQEQLNDDSHFDSKRENSTILGSYIYCGLRNSQGLLTLSEIEDHFFNSYLLVRERNREEEWLEIMQNILEPEHIKTIESITKIKKDKHGNLLSSILSSGQNIMLSTMTEVIANIENDSLLLFDEPELHLHPNAIANFMRMFYKLLSSFNSYAIISTHSPLITQEVPSKYIQVFYRSANTPIVEYPVSECFGENISVLTNDLFELREHENNYKSWFKKLRDEGKTYDEIVGFFGEDTLSYNSMTYLNSLFIEKRGS
ncbi:AAA family ATPase [Paenibacillus sp. HB172176]|uniref:AAA family ATPase n=1 Tax=Paenibacillus sp. HB172176 TaxID=2493690 RepID=UPI00143AF7CD|nr:AAA family ATPase [Paenibacillus sp. HB172176]